MRADEFFSLNLRNFLRFNLEIGLDNLFIYLYNFIYLLSNLFEIAELANKLIQFVFYGLSLSLRG